MSFRINWLRGFSIAFVLLSAGCSNLPSHSERHTSFHGRTPSTISSSTVSAPTEDTDPLSIYSDTSLTDPETETDLWQHLREGYQLDSSIENDRIEKQLMLYSRNQQFLDRITERGNRYLYFIIQELEKREMPLELALLPVVESAYDPFAYSRQRASGLWQFIPSTGQTFGLKQNQWYDDRRDVRASTIAALDYLQLLADRFDGDWYLALAAYNSGDGTVSRAIERNRRANRPTDFWSLQLPEETKAYVPRLIAVSKLIKSPEDYQVTLKPIANKPFFSVIDVGGQIDLAQAAQLAEVPLEELHQLNPGFSQGAITLNGPQQLLVPVEKKSTFEQALMDLPEEDRISWQHYTIRPGDSLSTIARQYHTTPYALQSLNNLRSSSIRAGHKILIPSGGREFATYSGGRESATYYGVGQQTVASNQQSRQAVNSSQKGRYQVKKGDTLWKIAQRFGVTVDKLTRWNRMATNGVLTPGQQLIVSSPTVRVAQAGERSPAIKKVGYRVRTGDSLYRIADRFNLSINDIMRWNMLSQNSYLRPGQALTLFIDATAAH